MLTHYAKFQVLGKNFKQLFIPKILHKQKQIRKIF